MFVRERKRAQEVPSDDQEVPDHSCLPAKSRGCRDVAAIAERCSVYSEQTRKIRRIRTRTQMHASTRRYAAQTMSNFKSIIRFN